MQKNIKNALQKLPNVTLESLKGKMHQVLFCKPLFTVTETFQKSEAIFTLINKRCIYVLAIETHRRLYMSIWGRRNLCTFHGLVQKMRIKRGWKKDHKS